MIVAVVPCRFDSLRDAHQLRSRLLEWCDDVILTTKDGLGPAYLEAWTQIPDFAWVLHVDVGSHPASSWQAMIRKVGTADILIGSRFLSTSLYVGRQRRARMSRFAAWACNVVTFWNCKDWTSGLRVYSPRARALLSEMEYSTSGHAWQIEALWAGLQGGLSVSEIPITYQAGRSSLNRKRIWEAIRLWWGMVWSSPQSFAIASDISTGTSTKSTSSETA